MHSTVIKRSVVIDGHKTSVSLEDAFWIALKQLAGERGVTISTLATAASHTRQTGNLSSHLRLMVLDHFKGQTPT